MESSCLLLLKPSCNKISGEDLRQRGSSSCLLQGLCFEHVLYPWRHVFLFSLHLSAVEGPLHPLPGRGLVWGSPQTLGSSCRGWPVPCGTIARGRCGNHPSAGRFKRTLITSAPVSGLLRTACHGSRGRPYWNTPPKKDNKIA